MLDLGSGVAGGACGSVADRAGLWGVPLTWVWLVGTSPQILEHPTSICDTGFNIYLSDFVGKNAVMKRRMLKKLMALNFFSCPRKSESISIYPADVILFEGILTLYSKEIRDMLDMKLFVDSDSDTRLSRRGNIIC